MIRIILAIAFLALIAPTQWSPFPSSDASEDVTAMDWAVMVQQAAADIGSICERRAQMCETGAKLGTHAKARAAAWTGQVQDWLSDDDASTGAATEAPQTIEAIYAARM